MEIINKEKEEIKTKYENIYKEIMKEKDISYILQ